MFDEHNLSNMPRRDLQSLAKSNGIRANLKSAEIIKQLLSLEHVENNDEFSSENTDANNHVSEAERSDNENAATPRYEVETVQSPEPHLEEQQSDDFMSQINDQDASPSDLLESVTEGSVPKHEINPQNDPPTGNTESVQDEAIPKHEINPQDDPPTDKVESAQDERIPESESINIAFDDQESKKSQSAVIPAENQSSSFKSFYDRTGSKQVPDSNPDPESNRPCSAKNTEADVEDLSSDTNVYSSENVQEALDTYRKIAMESAAAIHAHGCQIPETSASGSSRSVPPGIKSQSLAMIQDGPSIKSESDSVLRSKLHLDLQENPAESATSAMTKGPLSPVSAPVLEDPNHICLWSPSRMAERKKEFKNNEFGGTKRRLEGYMADGRTKLTETVRDHRRAQGIIDVPDQ